MSIKIARKSNPAWRSFLTDRTITVTQDPLVSRRDQFFVMGSCFAEEIRHALAEEIGADRVGPDYRQVEFDPRTAKVDNLPDHVHMNTYNAFSVLQEVERILGLWSPDPDDWWEVDGAWQCPYRRLVFGNTPEILAAVSASIDSVLKRAFAATDHFIFTFGMTEVFINSRSGKVANQKPGYGDGGGKTETVYHRAGFAENHRVISRLVDLIGAAKPNARIFMTVSPVPLKRTFSGEDIFVANTLSKSTLRAVLGEIAAERANVTYFPSYDAVIAGGTDAFEGDGRHVKRPVVQAVTKTFVSAYFGD